MDWPKIGDASFRFSLLLCLLAITIHLGIIGRTLGRIAGAAEMQRLISMNEAVGPEATARILDIELEKRPSPALKDTE